MSTDFNSRFGALGFLCNNPKRYRGIKDLDDTQDDINFQIRCLIPDFDDYFLKTHASKCQRIVGIFETLAKEKKKRQSISICGGFSRIY